MHYVKLKYLASYDLKISFLIQLQYEYELVDGSNYMCIMYRSRRIIEEPEILEEGNEIEDQVEDNVWNERRHLSVDSDEERYVIINITLKFYLLLLIIVMMK